jgi:hypothetical protein
VAGLARRRQPGVAAGAVLFMVVATISFAVRSPLGGNVGRLEDAVALPLTAVLAWQATGLQRAGRWPARLKVRAPASLRVAVVTLVGVPLLLSQWSPAWADLTTTGGTPTSRASYFAPLDAALRTWFAADPAGRVEVVPTAYHAEAAYVAAAFPLARGWERQLDVADNPIFYRPAALTPAGYRTWLLDNGVRFVALSSAPLDPAGRAEGRLVASGLVPGLRLVWTSPDWHLYLVLGSTGIVSGPATLIAAGRDGAIVSARSAGTVTVRLRQPSAWRVEGGPACVSAAPSPWVLLEVSGPGVIRLSVGPHQPWGHRPTCPPGA